MSGKDQSNQVCSSTSTPLLDEKLMMMENLQNSNSSRRIEDSVVPTPPDADVITESDEESDEESDDDDDELVGFVCSTALAIFAEMNDNQDGEIDDDRVSEMIWMKIAERANGGGDYEANSRDPEFEERATEMIQMAVYGATAFLARRRLMALGRAELDLSRSRYYYY